MIELTPISSEAGLGLTRSRPNYPAIKGGKIRPNSGLRCSKWARGSLRHGNKFTAPIFPSATRKLSFGDRCVVSTEARASSKTGGFAALRPLPRLVQRVRLWSDIELLFRRVF